MNAERREEEPHIPQSVSVETSLQSFDVCQTAAIRISSIGKACFIGWTYDPADGRRSTCAVSALQKMFSLSFSSAFLPAYLMSAGCVTF